MTIRLATPADVPALLVLSRDTHARSRYASLPYRAERVQQALLNVMQRGQGKYVLLASCNAQDHVVGALLGVLEQALFTDAYSASIMYFLVDPAVQMGGHGPRLLRAFELWAGNRGVADINFGINAGIDSARVARFARRMGYVGVGENLVKQVRGTAV
jgi:GNAT superfamily N-acetyltransferase